jgi:hypothetical protein
VPLPWLERCLIAELFEAPVEIVALDELAGGGSHLLEVFGANHNVPTRLKNQPWWL